MCSRLQSLLAFIFAHATLSEAEGFKYTIDLLPDAADGLAGSNQRHRLLSERLRVTMWPADCADMCGGAQVSAGLLLQSGLLGHAGYSIEGKQSPSNTYAADAHSEQSRRLPYEGRRPSLGHTASCCSFAMAREAPRCEDLSILCRGWCLY